jgi:hypothetical protein
MLFSAPPSIEFCFNLGEFTHRISGGYFFTCFCLFVSFAGGSGEWHQGLLFPMQAFYHLGHSSSPFCFDFKWGHIFLPRAKLHASHGAEITVCATIPILFV